MNAKTPHWLGMIIKIIINYTFIFARPAGYNIHRDIPSREWNRLLKNNKSLINMDKNRNLPSSSFHSLTFFAGLCIGLSPVAQAVAAGDQDKKQEDTLVVEATKPSLYAPGQSADPKFSRR